MEKQTFSGNYEADIASLNLRLRVSESFDLVSRQIMVRIGKFIKGSQQSLIRPFSDRCLFAAADQKNGFFLDFTGLFRRFIRDRIQ